MVCRTTNEYFLLKSVPIGEISFNYRKRILRLTKISSYLHLLQFFEFKIYNKNYVIVKASCENPPTTKNLKRGTKIRK